MLTVVLLGIAIGGMLAPRLARLQLVWVTAGSSLAVVAGYMLAGWVFSGGKPDLIHYAAPLMLPAAVLSGSLKTQPARDRKSTRLNSSHTVNSYAGFCL